MEEKWSWIKDMEGKYQVSTFGRIKSHCHGKSPKIMRTWGRRDGKGIRGWADHNKEGY